VKSASSNCVTRGTAFQLSPIRRAMTCRNGDNGFLLTGPHLEKSMLSAIGFDRSNRATMLACPSPPTAISR
jgi:hypothetical protein